MPPQIVPKRQICAFGTWTRCFGDGFDVGLKGEGFDVGLKGEGGDQDDAQVVDLQGWFILFSTSSLPDMLKSFETMQEL